MGDRQARIRPGGFTLSRILPFLLLLILQPFASGSSPSHLVKTGADLVLGKRLDILRGKRIGLITNQSGRLSSGEYLLDALISRGIEVTALFGPEHGIRGTEPAGESVPDSIDGKTHIPVFSLYGRIRKPTPAMLKNVDLLLFDIQDVGARFYTYLSTLGLCMEAAAERGIPFVVLDRPNPLGGMLTDGPVIPDSLRSFVGMFPVPVIYGLTIGELAAMANGEGWLAGGVRADLTVIPMEGWTRAMLWRDTGLPWIPPSPNIRRPETAQVYPATCYLEATNISEGRGTGDPFHLIGAPFIDGRELAGVLSSQGMKGVRVREVRFTPASSKFRGVDCSGVSMELSMSDSLRPVRIGLEILCSLKKCYPDSLVINRRGLARLLGDPEALDLISGGKSPSFIAGRWEIALQSYRERSSRYFIYPRK
jgi:uncharacterized protein YbbC (DUF1343 family)